MVFRNPRIVKTYKMYGNTGSESPEINIISFKVASPNCGLEVNFDNLKLIWNSKVEMKVLISPMVWLLSIYALMILFNG